MAVKDKTPPDVKAVVVDILLLFDTDKPANVAPLDARFSAYPEFTTVTVPVVLAIKLGVEVLIDPMLPEPEVNVIDDDPDNVPAVWVIAPETLALKFTIVPPALPPRAMPPLLAVAANEKDPPEVIGVVVAMLLSLETEKLVKVSPPEATLSAYPEFTTDTPPVVFTVKIGVKVSTSPIVPDPELSDIDVVPVKVPAVGAIAPSLDSQCNNRTAGRITKCNSAIETSNQ